MQTVTMNNCAYIATVCIQKVFWDVLTVVPFHKLGHKCFARSGPLLQIRSLMFMMLSHKLNNHRTPSMGVVISETSIIIVGDETRNSSFRAIFFNPGKKLSY